MIGRAAIAWLAFAATLAHASPPLVERVAFASFALEEHGFPVVLNAMLFRPAGAQDKRLPAVIALHGCGGMYSIAKSRRNELTIRHRTMAELLTGEGYAVLFPDSFRSRGREEICKQALRDRTITVSQRRLDTLAALAYLQERPDIAADRIAVLGWSNGGSTVLYTDNAKSSAVQHFREGGEAPFFRAAIAFYPGCYDSANAREGYAPAAPLLMLVGARDDWTSPQPCVALAERIRRVSQPIEMVVYPDTYHGFDGPDSQGRMHLDVPNGVHPGHGVTVAVNRGAREDAYRRVKAFLRDALAPAGRPFAEEK